MGTAARGIELGVPFADNAILQREKPLPRPSLLGIAGQWRGLQQRYLCFALFDTRDGMLGRSLATVDLLIDLSPRLPHLAANRQGKGGFPKFLLRLNGGRELGDGSRRDNHALVIKIGGDP